LDSIELNSLTRIEKKDLPRVIDRVKYNYNYNYAHPSIHHLDFNFLAGHGHELLRCHQVSSVQAMETMRTSDFTGIFRRNHSISSWVWIWME